MTNVMFSCILRTHALEEYIKVLELKASSVLNMPALLICEKWQCDLS